MGKFLIFIASFCLAFAAQAKPVLIEMYGDSTTYGAELLPAGNWVQSASNVPALIQSKYASGVTVVNKGISGATIPQHIIGAAPVTKTWAQMMSESSADIITINLSINDSNQQWETDHVINYYLGQMIDTAQASGKIVVIETANPINNALYDRLSQVSYVVRTLANSRALTLADHHLWIQTGLPNWKDFLPDGIHPNGSLYTYKANNLYAVLNPVVQSLLAR